MKKHKVILLCGALVLVIAAFVFLFLFKNRNTEKSYRNIQVVETAGIVTVARDKTGSLDAFENMNLESGDQIKTGAESHIILRLDNDKYVMLQENSSMELTASGTELNSRTIIQLPEGSVLVNIESRLSEESDFEISTPHAAMSVRGTVFEVRYEQGNGDYTSKVLVFEGEVAVLPSDSGAKEALTSAGTFTELSAQDGTVSYLVKDQKILPEDVRPEVLDQLKKIQDSGRDIKIDISALHPEEEDTASGSSITAGTNIPDDKSSSDTTDQAANPPEDTVEEITETDTGTGSSIHTNNTDIPDKNSEKENKGSNTDKTIDKTASKKTDDKKEASGKPPADNTKDQTSDVNKSAKNQSANKDGQDNSKTPPKDQNSGNNNGNDDDNNDNNDNNNNDNDDNDKDDNDNNDNDNNDNDNDNDDNDNDDSHDRQNNKDNGRPDKNGANNNRDDKDNKKEAGKDKGKDSDKGQKKDTDKKDSSASESDISSLVLTKDTAEDWESGGNSYIQLTFSIKNNSASTMTGWKIKLEFSEKYTVSQSWNASSKTDGTIIYLSPKQYNTDLKSGETVKDIGLILYGSNAPKLQKATIVAE